MQRFGFVTFFFYIFPCVSNASPEHATTSAGFGPRVDSIPTTAEYDSHSGNIAPPRQLAKKNGCKQRRRLTMNLGLVVDKAFVDYSCGKGDLGKRSYGNNDWYRYCNSNESHKSGARAMLRNMVAFASAPFENQFNIQFKPLIVMYDDARRHMAWMNRNYANCEKYKKDMAGDVKEMQEWVKKFRPRDAALWVHVTGCLKYSFTGQARIGHVGQRTDEKDIISRRTLPQNVLAVSMQGGQRVLCHEIGHSFGAHHPRNHGTVKNKGLMNYGHYTVDGRFEFYDVNVDQMCPKIQSILKRTGRRSSLLPYDSVWASSREPKRQDLCNDSTKNSCEKDMFCKWDMTIEKCFLGCPSGPGEYCRASRPFMCRGLNCDGQHCCERNLWDCKDGLLQGNDCPGRRPETTVRPTQGPLKTTVRPNRPTRPTQVCHSSGVEYELKCVDGTQCDVQREGWACCKALGGRAQCPSSQPFMCKQKSCNDENCCSYTKQWCNARGGLVDGKNCPSVRPKTKLRPTHCFDSEPRSCVGWKSLCSTNGAVRTKCRSTCNVCESTRSGQIQQDGKEDETFVIIAGVVAGAVTIGVAVAVLLVLKQLRTKVNVPRE
eukprot:GEMP01023383.1.p1 GENE.GEMP01023383.1~~GEMP01023383.1.p1  ORF type:complete len:601 (+),score=87.81 GEMP01023383.1:102-1904(+)